jgi:hypothetical protein
MANRTEEEEETMRMFTTKGVAGEQGEGSEDVK